MSEKQLLLPSARLGVVVWHNRAPDYLYYFLVAIGMLLVLVGAASLLSRATARLGVGHTALVFGPAVTLLEPQTILDDVAQTLATTTPILPTQLRIPVLGITAAVEMVGKKADGSMATPRTFSDVGWYALGSRPGEAGNTVIAGHVNNALTQSGVFAHLSQLRVGERIEVSDARRTLVYVVRETAQYPAETAPAASIFATAGPSQLVLITCDGEWDTHVHSFDKRLVVYARLLGEK